MLSIKCIYSDLWFDKLHLRTWNISWIRYSARVWVEAFETSIDDYYIMSWKFWKSYSQSSVGLWLKCVGWLTWLMRLPLSPFCKWIRGIPRPWFPSFSWGWRRKVGGGWRWGSGRRGCPGVGNAGPLHRRSWLYRRLHLHQKYVLQLTLFIFRNVGRKEGASNQISGRSDRH